MQICTVLSLLCSYIIILALSLYLVITRYTACKHLLSLHHNYYVHVLHSIIPIACLYHSTLIVFQYVHVSTCNENIDKQSQTTVASITLKLIL